MKKSYAILQKKLEELELQLSHNNTALIPSHDHHLSRVKIPQKFLFLANLLSAETASCPTKPRHLKHIARRLAHLEAAFRDSGATTTAKTTQDSLVLLDHADGSSSTCSCTESCLNDDGEVASDRLSSCLDDEEEGGEFYECVEEKEEEKKKEEIMIIKEERKVVGAMACGFFIGVALMGVVIFFIEIFDYFQVQENSGFVTPT